MPDDVTPAAGNESVADELAQIEADIAGDTVDNPTVDPVTNPDSGNEPVEDDPTPDPEKDPATDDPNTDSDPEKQDPTNEEVDLDFRKTPTSIQNMVKNFESLTPEDRSAKIKGLTETGRKTEIEALKEAYPDDFKQTSDDTPDEDGMVKVSKDDWAAMQERLEKVEQATDTEGARELLEKMRDSKPELERKVRDQMLKDQFGSEFVDITKDPKFLEAYGRFDKLEIEDRLEAACLASPTARKLLTEKNSTSADMARVSQSPKSTNGPAVKQPSKHTLQDMITGKSAADELSEIEAQMG